MKKFREKGDRNLGDMGPYGGDGQLVSSRPPLPPLGFFVLKKLEPPTPNLDFLTNFSGTK